MFTAILFAILVAMVVYIILEYLAVWLGCLGSLVYVLALIFVPIMLFVLICTGFVFGFVELFKVIIGLFV